MNFFPSNRMELVVPSLVFLLVGVALAFFVIPRLAPTILIGGSAVVLGAALYIHYTRFGVMEYERATWQHNLKAYGNWIIVAAILLGAYGFYAMNNGVATSVLPESVANVLNANAAPALPSLELPQAGGGFGSMARRVGDRLNSLMRHGRMNH